MSYWGFYLAIFMCTYQYPLSIRILNMMHAIPILDQYWFDPKYYDPFLFIISCTAKVHISMFANYILIL